MSDLENQIAAFAESLADKPYHWEQPSLFDDWTPEEHDDLDDISDEELAEALRDALRDPGPQPGPAPVPTFRTAYIVLIDQNGDTAVQADLSKPFNVQRDATDEDIRRTSRDVHDFYQAAYVADWVVGALNPRPSNPIADKARERGLLD